MKNNKPMNTLLPQPGQGADYNPKFHPLPGPWAQEQIAKESSMESSRQTGSSISRPENGLQKALAAERSQHEYWEQWQGVTPGRPVYEDPRGSLNDTLQPNAKYGTEGPGYG